MVAKISTPKRLLTALNYNENKVRNGKAECIHAGNFLRNVNDMNFYQKLERFENMNTLNDRATTKTLHISLNFDPREDPSKEKCSQIAALYLDKIGFGEQPYLVYKHNDAGHPHIHIVTTTIQSDGSRINTHNIGRNQSEKARKEIERSFNLIKAENRKSLAQSLKPLNVIKLTYGKTETKRAISHIVNTVMNNYKFASLPEFNAALQQFNVIADRGKEDGLIYKTGGLIYHILDQVGNKIGVPIKASSIYAKPTLVNLEKKFVQNEPVKEPFKQQIKNLIDDAFNTYPGNLKKLINELEKKQVYTVLRQNKEGFVYGITFVDNKNKCVFNGSDLGKQYSASFIQSRLSDIDKHEQKVAPATSEEHAIKSSGTGQRDSIMQKDKVLFPERPIKKDSLFDQLLSVKEQNENVPFQLLKKKRKKKKDIPNS